MRSESTVLYICSILLFRYPFKLYPLGHALSLNLVTYEIPFNPLLSSPLTSSFSYLCLSSSHLSSTEPFFPPILSSPTRPPKLVPSYSRSSSLTLAFYTSLALALQLQLQLFRQVFCSVALSYKDFYASIDNLYLI